MLYILFNIYLVIHMAACMGNKRLMNSQVSNTIVTVDDGCLSNAGDTYL